MQNKSNEIEVKRDGEISPQNKKAESLLTLQVNI